jgi:hypothetical protein
MATAGVKSHEIYSPTEREPSCLGFARNRDSGAGFNPLFSAHRHNLLTADLRGNYPLTTQLIPGRRCKEDISVAKKPRRVVFFH